MIVNIDGEDIVLGTVEATPTIGMVDYSRRVTDDFGVTTVVKRDFARRMSVRLAVPFEDVDETQRRLAAIRATPARWTADDRFAWLDFVGFYKDFDIDLAVPPLSFCTLTVEGLAETEAGADDGSDPAPDGAASTLRLLNPIELATGAVVSNVAEADHPEWANATTYAAGAKVIKAATHRIYESAQGGNLNHDPAGDSGHWIDIGTTNRWAMFDQALGTVTEQGTPIIVSLTVTDVDAVALLDVVGTTVRVQAPGYDQTKPVGAGAITFLDLPLTSGVVTVTVSGGPVQVGTLLIGRLASLGVTEAAPSAGINDYSRKETDEFGEVTVVERAWAKRMSARSLIRTEALDQVANRIASVRARPCLWIGDDELDSLTVYGFFKEFSIEVGENVSKLAISIEGLSQAASRGVLAPNWTDVVDNDPVTHPKPYDGATVGGTVGEDIRDPDGNLLPAEEIITSEGTSKDTAHIAGVPASVWTSSVEEAAQAIRSNALAAVRNALGAHADDGYQSGFLFRNGEPVVTFVERTTQKIAGDLAAEVQERATLAAAVFDEDTGLEATREHFTQLIVDLDEGKASATELVTIRAVVEDASTGLSATRTQFAEAVADLDGNKVSVSTYEELAAIFYDPATGYEAKRAELEEVKGVLAEADNLEAFWRVRAAAGSDPAYAELMAREDGSVFRAVAKEVYLAAVAGGVSRAGLRLLDNLVTLYGNVLVQGRIKQSTGGAGYLLAMESFRVSLSNNDVYTMTDVFGAPPDVRPGPPSIALDPPGPGEFLDIGTKALSATAWTAKVEIVTPGTISTQNTTGSSTSPGTGPTLQRDKPTVEDAIDGYLFSVAGEAFVTEGLSISVYEDFTLTGRATAWFNDGSGWMQGASADIYAAYYSGSPSGETLSFNVAIEAEAPGPIGQHGGKEFGVTVELFDGFGNPLEPTSLTFTGVTYTTQSGETRRSATPSGQKQIFYVTPRNTAL